MVVLCLVIMIFIYLIMITVYVAIVHKEDKNADIYNESWLYQDNDISYSIGTAYNNTAGRKGENRERKGVRVR